MWYFEIEKGFSCESDIQARIKGFSHSYEDLYSTWQCHKCTLLKYNLLSMSMLMFSCSHTSGCFVLILLHILNILHKRTCHLSIKCLCSFRQNPVNWWILMMRSLNWISTNSLMSTQYEWEIWLRSNEGIAWIKIHPLTGFCFYSVMYYEYISIIWDTMNYFVIIKSNSSLITVLKMFHIAAPWHHRKHPLSCHKWLGDIVCATM